MKKAFRIKKAAEIEHVMKTGSVVRNKYLSLFKKENHELRHFRFAISVPKKYGNAVERNTMKRRIRMIVSQQTIEALNDFFIVIHPPAKSLSFERLKKVLEQSMTKLELR